MPTLSVLIPSVNRIRAYIRAGRKHRGFSIGPLAMLALWFVPASAQAWTSTLYLTGSGAEVFSESNLPTNSVSNYVYLADYSSTTDYYFCMEMIPVLNTAVANAEVLFAKKSNTTPPGPTGTPTRHALGTWTPVSGQTNVQTFSLPATQPPGYQILAPANPTTLQYKLGYRIYGKLRGPADTSTGFLRPFLPWPPTNASIKLTVSDQPMLEGGEPDAVALPVTNAWGEPTLTVQGLADKVTISSPIPASYTLGWSAAGAASFKVTGGTGAGAIPAAGVTSGTSRAFSGVPQSTQTYLLETQGPASIAWKINPSATWEIFRGATLVASGTGTQASANVTQKGVHTLRVNGIDKTAEDEIVNVTDGFLKRSKTIQVTVGSP